MKVFIILTAVSLFGGAAFAAGTENVFRERPAFSAKAHQLLPVYRQIGDFERAKAYSSRLCPIADSYAEQILRKIIVSNNLNEFSESDYGPRIVVNCENEIGSTETKLDGAIHLAGGDILNSKSADELAFIIAHELAHVSMGHAELLVGTMRGFDDLKTDLNPRTQEWEADQVGIFLIKNAGFDPSASYDILLNTRKFKDSFFLGFDFSGNSPFAERQRLIALNLKESKYAAVARSKDGTFLRTQIELRSIPGK